MNVPFTLKNRDLEPNFIQEANNHGLYALKGHRYVGGIRASIYNAMPIEGVKKLAQFMKDYSLKNS